MREVYLMKVVFLIALLLVSAGATAAIYLLDPLMAVRGW